MLPGIMAGMGAGFQPMAAPGNPSLLSTITTAALTTNLVLCLDAADSSSYSSGQKWLDRSSGGYDFFLGATSSASTDDPTFNGSPGGLSSNEYWSFDGGDYFTYDSANEAWMNAIHKDAAAYTILASIYAPSFSSSLYMLATGATAGGDGFGFSINTAGKPAIFVRKAAGTSLNRAADTAVSTSSWHIIGISVDENGGAVSFFYVDGAYDQQSASDTFNASYTSPGTADASSTMTIGAVGGTSTPAPSGSKIGFVAAWSSALSKANFDTLYAALKGRYGLT